MTNTNQRILVIGGTGMLGKPVAQQLKADGFNVRVLARTPSRMPCGAIKFFKEISHGAMATPSGRFM